MRWSLCRDYRSRQKVKTIAAQIEENVPAGETVYAVNPDFQPFYFMCIARCRMSTASMSCLPGRTFFWCDPGTRMTH